nr:MAG TPA: hypothetical protein [Caudoviricetes sp.]
MNLHIPTAERLSTPYFKPTLIITPKSSKIAHKQNL